MTSERNRLWIDGCFDFTHHGHSGAILQARRLIPADTSCGTLLCGVHNDDEIYFNKGGRPVMNENERYEHTLSNRWCGELIKNAPYVTQPDVLDAHHCRYVVHGDDITTDANGEDCYQQMKDMGRFLVVKRTEGVSTTDIIHRILTGQTMDKDSRICQDNEDVMARFATGSDGHSPWCHVFAKQVSKETAVVCGGYDLDLENMIYVEGDFDLFHIGHIEQLALLKEMHGPESRLIVGISTTGDCFMTQLERVLSVLSCKYVDAVVVEPESKPAVKEVWTLDDPRLKNGQFGYLDKSVIVNRIQAERSHYVARNIKKGMSGYT
ncbi:LANO_0F06458g1_1 [Lachancea nothofagi CBS 11611]|uniref:ethanolamine-phosphate cytidylyltransferase n=1 Tax=Lachancea nothofagi CBS 11611 TaxID=1266666 RepID=A0A1G4K8J1_9SACH|nr:LANO_0F06458g1_1 [Lachancea nothofagi CBS 11611]